MRKFLDLLAARMPPHFRVLYRQFLLRVVDLEALSIEADIPRFLGQFAGVMIMWGLLLGVGVVMFPPPPAMSWPLVQSRVGDMLLAVGLCAVLAWDSTFPDRRDVMILAPLPLPSRTILSAKIAASGTLFLIAVLALNVGTSFGYSLIFGTAAGGFLGLLRFFAAYWLTMFLAAAFLYGAILAIQGLGALLFPRRAFLRVSAVLQLAAFGFFLGVRLLQPSFAGAAPMREPASHTWLVSSPTFWFFALFEQLNGALPAELSWLASRAWIALAIVAAGAAVSLLLCYTHTMKKTVEEPDLVPGAAGLHWIPRFGGSLRTAIALFSLRSITRSRQHRLALAFYWSVIFALALSWIRHEIRNPPEPVNIDFLMSTFLMMCFAVLGLRGVFSLPISLRANWMLRVTQLQPTTNYLAATRLCLLLFAVAPICVIAAAFSFHFTPWQPAARHLAFLALAGWVLVELGLIRFYKVPFTCSYMPGKANIQVIFWGFVFVFLILDLALANYEFAALRVLPQYFLLMAITVAAGVGLFAYNRIQAGSAQLYFEELPPEIITRLGLIYVPPAAPTSTSISSK